LNALASYTCITISNNTYVKYENLTYDYYLDHYKTVEVTPAGLLQPARPPLNSRNPPPTRSLRSDERLLKNNTCKVHHSSWKPTQSSRRKYYKKKKNHRQVNNRSLYTLQCWTGIIYYETRSWLWRLFKYRKIKFIITCRRTRSRYSAVSFHGRVIRICRCILLLWCPAT